MCYVISEVRAWLASQDMCNLQGQVGYPQVHSGVTRHGNENEVYMTLVGGQNKWGASYRALNIVGFHLRGFLQPQIDQLTSKHQLDAGNTGIMCATCAHIQPANDDYNPLPYGV